jgi:DNA-binding response OmpR family regulator
MTPAPADQAAPVETTAALPSVLIVDYNLAVRSALQEYLGACGYRVFTANGLAATKWFFESDRHADIVVSEVEFNGSNDGFALAQWLRRNRPEVQVLLTGSPERMAGRAARLCERSETLHKPYDHAELERRIRSLARR